MPDFYIDGKKTKMVEKWRDLIVFGEFNTPCKAPGFILRIPEGRVPWSKTIAPAINRLVQSWVPEPKPYVETEMMSMGGKVVLNRSRIVKNRKPKAYWNVDGEGAVFIGANFYSDTKKPIPPSKRLWDCRSLPRYRWTGSDFKLVSRSKKVLTK